MRKLIALAVISFLFCGCERKEDCIIIADYSRPNEPCKRVEIPRPLVYDRHEYNITSTGAVVTIYFTREFQFDKKRESK